MGIPAPQAKKVRFATQADVHNIAVAHQLIREEDEVVYGARQPSDNGNPLTNAKSTRARRMFLDQSPVKSGNALKKKSKSSNKHVSDSCYWRRR
jgi:hypothetical protein